MISLAVVILIPLARSWGRASGVSRSGPDSVRAAPESSRRRAAGRYAHARRAFNSASLMALVNRRRQLGVQQRSDLHQDVITPSQVSRRAAPAIPAWCRTNPARTGLNSTYRAAVRLIRRVYLADGATQALGGLRDNDQVSMVGHQAICPDRDLLSASKMCHELEVVLVVFLTEERLLSAVSPLGDMVGHARSYHTCKSSHAGKLTRPQPRVKS